MAWTTGVACAEPHDCALELREVGTGDSGNERSRSNCQTRVNTARRRQMRCISENVQQQAWRRAPTERVLVAHLIVSFRGEIDCNRILVDRDENHEEIASLGIGDEVDAAISNSRLSFHSAS